MKRYKEKIMICGFNDSKLDDACDGKSDDGGFSCILFFCKNNLTFSK